MSKFRDEQTQMQFNVEIKNYYDALETEETEQQPEAKINEEWQHLKRRILSASEKCLPKKRKISRKEWMTEEILEN